MTIKNCAQCGGNHFGSTKCPSDPSEIARIQAILDEPDPPKPAKSTLIEQVDALLKKWRDREVALCRRADGQPSTQYAMRLGAEAEAIANMLIDFEPLRDRQQGEMARLQAQIATLEAEQARLAEQVVALQNGNARYGGDVLRERLEAAEAALSLYGQHRPECDTRKMKRFRIGAHLVEVADGELRTERTETPIDDGPRDCTCGFSASPAVGDRPQEQP